MRIILGAETEGPAAGRWFELQKEFTALLSILENNDYGMGLDEIHIISIIMRQSFFTDGGYKERKYYSKKTKSADIRLRIDYMDFWRATNSKCREIYLAHILQSISIAGLKAGNSFKLDLLLSDVKRILSI